MRERGDLDRGVRLAATRARALAAVVAFAGVAVALSLGRPVSAASDAPSAVDASALMHRVAAAYAKTATGVVGVRSHSTLRIDAPFYHRRIVEDTWYVFVDGVLARSAQPPDPRKPPVRDPYRAANLDDYRFRDTACDGCAAGNVAIAYDSAHHDVEHAFGTLVIEPETARIVSQTETPYVLPFPTRSGSLVATWGDAAGGWFPLSIDGAFIGGIGPFTGRARYAQSLADYARYPTIDAAVDTLEPAAKASPIPR